MQVFKSILTKLLIVVVLLALGFIFTRYYSFIFKKTVRGEVISAEAVNPSVMPLVGNTVNPDLMFSYAVAVKDDKGHIYTSSSTDRQWAAFKQGYCVEVAFYPYAPWDLDKSGTYFNARLIEMYDCEKTNSP